MINQTQIAALALLAVLATTSQAFGYASPPSAPPVSPGDTPVPVPSTPVPMPSPDLPGPCAPLPVCPPPTGPRYDQLDVLAYRGSGRIETMVSKA